MKQYHPTDSRYRGPSSPTLRAKSTRAQSVVPAAQTSWASAPQSPQVEHPEPTNTARKQPFWMHFLPVGLLVSDKDEKEASRTASTSHWRASVFKVAFGLLLYAVMSQSIDGSMVTF